MHVGLRPPETCVCCAYRPPSPLARTRCRRAAVIGAALPARRSLPKSPPIASLPDFPSLAPGTARSGSRRRRGPWKYKPPAEAGGIGVGDTDKLPRRAGHSTRLVGSGVAHAVSPDVRFRHPASSSLGVGCALGILPSLAAYAVSTAWATPPVFAIHKASTAWQHGCHATSKSGSPFPQVRAPHRHPPAHPSSFRTASACRRMLRSSPGGLRPRFLSCIVIR